MKKLDEIELPDVIAEEVKQLNNSGTGYCKPVGFCNKRKGDCWKTNYLNCEHRRKYVKVE